MKMEKETLFTESQKFKQWWLWLILIGINGHLLWRVFRQVIGGHHFDNNPMTNTELIVLTGFIIILTIFLASLRLDTAIKNDGIYVRFFPIQLKFKHYSWDKLTKTFVREYAPLKEYGGWGLRLGLFGKGSAYNISGNKGLQLEFTDSKKLLIGTNKPEELTAVLNKSGHLKP